MAVDVQAHRRPCVTGALRELPRRYPGLVPDRDAAVAKLVRVVVRDPRGLARPRHRLVRDASVMPWNTLRSGTRSSSGHVSSIASMSHSGRYTQRAVSRFVADRAAAAAARHASTSAQRRLTASPSRSAPCSIVTNSSLHFVPHRLQDREEVIGRRRVRLLAYLLRQLHARITSRVRVAAGVVEQQPERRSGTAARCPACACSASSATHAATSVAVIVNGSRSPNVSPIFLSAVR